MISFPNLTIEIDTMRANPSGLALVVSMGKISWNQGFRGHEVDFGSPFCLLSYEHNRTGCDC
jgi:hypothetical protein